jgi:hypothetical protein
MSRYRALIGIIISAVGFLVLLGFSQLELYPRRSRVPASREVRANSFYALEKWLASSGHPVRSTYRVFSPDLAGFIRELSGREGIVFLESSLFSWNEAEEALLPWLREGGALLLSLNPAWDEELEGDLLDFFDSLKIRVQDEKDLPDPEAEEAGAYFEAEAETGADGREGVGKDEGLPLFHRRFRFSGTGENPAGERDGGGNSAGEEAGPVFLKDHQGLGRLAEIPLGRGSLTVIGLPLFMYNSNLKEAANARLAWDLTAGKSPAERPEILFVRSGQAVKSLTGRLLERGNILPLLAAALFLILTGFWMLIPSFGIPRRENPDGGPRSIRERFRAEALFLKKHRALGLYLEAYIREIEYRGRLRGRDTAEFVEPVKAALGSGKRLSSPEALRFLASLMEVLRGL